MQNIGDNEGSLRVFVLPQNLSKPSVTEKEVMRQFFEREVKRVEYFRARFELRKEEAAAKKPEEEESHEEDKKVLVRIDSTMVFILIEYRRGGRKTRKRISILCDSMD